MYFYEVLQEIMNEKSLTIPEVARMSDLADSTIRSIISRQTKTVALEVAFKLSKGLNVSLERLNGDSVIEKPRFILNKHEEHIVTAYRRHPEMQEAVKKLLDVKEGE